MQTFIRILQAMEEHPALSGLGVTGFMLFVFVPVIASGSKTAGLIMVLLLIVFCIALLVLNGISKSYLRRARENLKLDNYTGIVTVNSRTHANRMLLTSERYYETYNKYNPASATFTAATVGGVTTGGWDFKEAHYTTGEVHRTDKWAIVYRTEDKKNPFVADFKLNDKDLQAAKQDAFLSQFVTGSGWEKINFRPLYRVASKNKAYADEYVRKTKDIYAAQNMIMADMTKTMLTRDEIERVIAFLCGE